MKSPRVVVATAVLVATFAALAAPALAVDGADLVIWRNWAPGHKALIVLEGRQGGGARIVGAIKGLENGTTYQIVGTNENCASAVTTNNRTFVLSVSGNTHANGTFFIGGTDGGVWKTTQFIRIREQGGDVWACGRAKPVTVDPNDANVIYARFASEGELRGIVLVESLANGRERLSVAVGDVNGDGTDDLSVRGSPRKCSVPTGTVTFAFKLENVLISSFKSATIDITQNELDGLRSIRIRKLTGDGGQDWFPDCAKSILLGLLLP